MSLPALTFAAIGPAVADDDLALSPYGSQSVTGTLLSDTGMAIADQIVTLYANGASLFTAAPVVTNAQGSFFASISLPSAGTVTLSAASADSSGNVATSPTLSVSSQIDATQFGQVSMGPGSLGTMVDALYLGVVGHTPDLSSFKAGVDALNAGTALADLTQQLLSSATYSTQYGGAATQSPADFIATLYQNAAGRIPESAGLQFYTDQLQGGMTQADVASEIALSPESIARVSATFPASAGMVKPDGTAGDVARVYYGVLGRAPDSAGLHYLEGVISGGGTLTDVVNDVLASPEYLASSANLTNAQFVESLYQNAMGRAPDAGQGWTALLDGGASRTSVAMNIVESPEAKAYLAPSVDLGVSVGAMIFLPSGTAGDMARVYYGVLGRAPDSAGLHYLEGVISGGGTLTDVVNDVLASPEYLASSANLTNTQFVESLYQNATGRASDVGQGWTALLDGGASRASVAMGIVESPEARAYLAPSVDLGFKVA